MNSKWAKGCVFYFLVSKSEKNISAATELCQCERLATRKSINMSANEQIQKQSYL